MKKKNKSFLVKPTLLLAASAVLLIGSTVGSARAALTYYSDNYVAQVNMSNIGVSLLEQGVQDQEAAVVSSDGTTDQTAKGELLSGMLGENEKIVPGKLYDELLTVQNTGSIDQFVRVIITKEWKDADGNTDNTVSPATIHVELDESNGWVEDKNLSTAGRIVMYYTSAIASQTVTPSLTKSIWIDGEIAKYVKAIKSEDGKTVKYEYKYDGYTFTLEAEVDAIQTHNVNDAIRSAWGVTNITADSKSLTVQ